MRQNPSCGRLCTQVLCPEPTTANGHAVQQHQVAYLLHLQYCDQSICHAASRSFLPRQRLVLLPHIPQPLTAPMCFLSYRPIRIINVSSKVKILSSFTAAVDDGNRWCACKYQDSFRVTHLAKWTSTTSSGISQVGCLVYVWKPTHGVAKQSKHFPPPGLYDITMLRWRHVKERWSPPLGPLTSKLARASKRN
eukprot:1145963-Pelagomonas_calceolata.AAC.4